MKKFIKYTLMGLMATGMLATTSCSDILEEQPRATFDPSFFTTKGGIEGGLTSLYAHTRYFYGQYFYAYMENGTDEYTWGQSADGNFKNNDFDPSGVMTPSDSRADAIWGVCFSNINTASGIIENAESVNLAPELVAEAYFFRAFDYFMLVQAYGGVPLDLGAGELKFNTKAIRSSVRNTVAEVYEKCIIPDFKKAVEDLPDTQRKTGALCKQTARLFLAKAYLTYAWWLENPKNIATYPACDRNSGAAQSYFQEAYKVANYAIEHKAEGPFDLCPTFYAAHAGMNDHNMEQMLYADHTEFNEEYDAQNHGYAGGSAPDNFCVWFATCNYPNARSVEGQPTLNREAAQSYGRPWTRMSPVHEVFSKVFNDPNDARRDVTFVLNYLGNWNRAGIANATLTNANGMQVKQGDPVLTFEEFPVGTVKYDNTSNNGVGAGSVPGRADYVISLNEYNRKYYPGLWKLGTYRTDNNGGMGQPNGAVTRPFVIAKFSEFYLVAAEAAVKLGNNADAVNALIPLRQRAGRHSYSANKNNDATSIADMMSSANIFENKEDAMLSSMPKEITIDYVLDERMRELFGECTRRFDLIRTQTWTDRASTYTMCDANDWDHTPKTFTRQIQAHHWLSPIPQGQINSLELSDAEKDAYQNPGYVTK